MILLTRMERKVLDYLDVVSPAVKDRNSFSSSAAQEAFDTLVHRGFIASVYVMTEEGRAAMSAADPIRASE